MSSLPSTPPSATPQPPHNSSPADVGLLERLALSKRAAGCVITFLPLAGLLTSLFFGLPVFAALMAGCLLLAAALTCGQAVVACTGQALRLLVSARLVLLLVLAALLFCATGSLWAALVSALLLWLCCERLLGRHTLHEMRVRLRRPE